MKKKESLALLVAWNLHKFDNQYYTASTHYVYVEYLSTIYNRIYLVSSVKEVARVHQLMSNSLNKLGNISIVELPETISYLNSIKNIRVYTKVLKKVGREADLFYCRVPDPFCWMPRLLYKKKTIMHFVGDAIDATKHNEKWSWIKKRGMIFGYFPEYLLTLFAARRSCVYTNGYHLVNKLSKYGIKPTPVISSTISEEVLNDNLPMFKNDKVTIRLIYIGYIRYAKGMNLLMNLWLKLKKEGVHFIFDVVGDGEMFDEVKEFVSQYNLDKQVVLHGHIDSKETMNKMLRASDLFVFPSLSEGSPRVVIEAMAQGIPVISTPVGSLPTTFNDKETIRFFDFNDSDQAFNIIKEYQKDKSPFIKQRDLAYYEVKNKYTLEMFLSKIATYEA